MCRITWTLVSWSWLFLGIYQLYVIHVNALSRILNVVCQMVCDTSGMELLETVWEKTPVIGQTICLSLFNQIISRRVLLPAEPVCKSDIYLSKSREEWKNLFHEKKKAFRVLLLRTSLAATTVVFKWIVAFSHWLTHYKPCQWVLICLLCKHLCFLPQAQDGFAQIQLHLKKNIMAEMVRNQVINTDQQPGYWSIVYSKRPTRKETQLPGIKPSA